MDQHAQQAASSYLGLQQQLACLQVELPELLTVADPLLTPHTWSTGSSGLAPEALLRNIFVTSPS